MNDWSKRLQSLTGEGSTDAGDDARRLARVERSRTEMLAQGTAIAETLAREAGAVTRLADKWRGKIGRVVILGCGDSWFAAIATRLAWERLTGLPTEPAQAFDWAHYASATANARTLVIGLTSGGNTPAVMAGLRMAQARGAMTLGITNTAGSPVVTEFDGLMVHATRRGWPTQSSTAAIALLIALAGALGGRALDMGCLPAIVDAVARDFDARARAVAKRWAETRLVLFAGGGPNFAAAAFGAAKVQELSPIHAIAMPLEEDHHYRAQKAGDPLFLVAPDAESRERALDTALVSQDVGGNTVALLMDEDVEIAARVGESWILPRVAPELAPIVASVPLHLFAYHFAKARFARGLGYPPALGPA